MPFDFEKNSVVDNLDSVPEEHRGLYVEAKEGDNQGKFTIASFAKPLVESYVGVSKALDKTRGDLTKANDESAKRRVTAKRLKETLGEFDITVDDDADPIDILKSKFSEVTEAAARGKNIDLNKIKQEHERKTQEAVEAVVAERDGMFNTLREHLVRSEALTALTKHKAVAPSVLVSHIESHAKVVKDDNGKYVVRIADNDGSYRTNGSGGWLGIDEVVAEMKVNPEYLALFKSETKGGTGTPPNQGAANRQAQQGADSVNSNSKIAQGLSKRGIT